MSLTQAERPIASLSLDLDNQWSYMKTHGDCGWEAYPTYLDVLLPHIIGLLDNHNVQITFFVVGKDAMLQKNSQALSLITRAGHTVGNHSFHHEPWLHLYRKTAIEVEIAQSEAAIEAATGQRPTGFRGPGFSFSKPLFEVLADRDYLFDAGTLPTWIGPLARSYYFRTARLSKEEREKRGALFGRIADGIRPVRPYFWSIDEKRKLLEIPVTTVPILRTPFHLSYLLYLYRVSPWLMDQYLLTALNLCALTGTEPSFLLHPLDVIGGDQVGALRFFPGMDLLAAEKQAVFDQVITVVKRHFRLVDMYTHARAILDKHRAAALPVGEQIDA